MAQQRKYRVGLIGAGAIAQGCHAPGYAKSDRVELVAFADPVKARHDEMTERFEGIRGYKDHTSMLQEEQLDIVSVCTPNAAHAAPTIAALEAGCHVLCEKPMAITLDETDAMIAAAKKARKKLMIGFTHRMMTGPEKCREMLRAGGIGKPFMMRVRFAHGGPYPGWAKDPDTFYRPEISAGGAMLDMGIHAIDLCNWIMGPVVSVTATCKTLLKRIKVDDNAVLLLEFKNGALGYIEVGWTSKPGFTGLELYGSEGSLICDYLKGLTLFGGKASAGQDSVAEWQTLDPTPTQGGWDTEIEHWLDVVSGDARLHMDGKAGRAALEVALAAYESSRTGRRVTLGA